MKIEKNHDFCKKKILVWCDDPPEDPVISIFAGCLANHDRAHSLWGRLHGEGQCVTNSERVPCVETDIYVRVCPSDRLGHRSTWHTNSPKVSDGDRGGAHGRKIL